MSAQLVVRLLRAAVALLAATALTVNLIHALDVPSSRLINYFSYFTNISNIFAVVTLAVGALRDPASRRWELVRGAATFCTTVTGVIYALFLTDVSVGVTDPWINDVIHRVVPAFMLLDWWLVASAPVDPRQALRWLAIPVAYLAYTLTRGPLAGDWYPYPFLDPTRAGGYLRVALFSAAVTVALALLAFGLAKLGRRHRERRPPRLN